MGTWSIDPSGGLASIDSTGKLTYQEHTEDKTYKITYQDDTCGPITKNITIKGCTPPPPPTSGEVAIVVYNDEHDNAGDIESITAKFGGSIHTGTLMPDSEVRLISCDVAIYFVSFTPGPLPDETLSMIKIKVSHSSGSVTETTKQLYDRIEENTATGCKHRVIGVKTLHENHCLDYDPDVHLVC